MKPIKPLAWRNRANTELIDKFDAWRKSCQFVVGGPLASRAELQAQLSNLRTSSEAVAVTAHPSSCEAELVTQIHAELVLIRQVLSGDSSNPVRVTCV